MSLPKDKIEKINELIQSLDDKDADQVVVFLEEYIKTKKQSKRTKPSDFFGIWADKNIDVEKVSKELREEWNRNIS
ncbi:MAG: hypothetical protein V2B14_01325 [bacterium]